MVQSDKKVPLSFLVLEDEPLALDYLYGSLEESIQKFSSGNYSSDNVQVVNIFKKADNLNDAKEIIYSGGCDIFLVDYRTKATPNSPKGDVSALPLLKEIIDKQLFVAAIGHTGFQDQCDVAERDNLCVTTIIKSNPRSVEIVVEKAIVLFENLALYKTTLFSFYMSLIDAVKQSSPIDRQDALSKARYFLSEISIPSWAPPSYRKSLIMLQSIIFRVSSIPSKNFSLGQLSEKLLLIIWPLIKKLGTPKHSYPKDTVPILKSLEEAGYEVIMRINDD